MDSGRYNDFAMDVQTIIDYDKVAVLEAGKVVEYDTPDRLLTGAAGKGYFRELVNELGPEAAARLTKAALASADQQRGSPSAVP